MKNLFQCLLLAPLRLHRKHLLYVMIYGVMQCTTFYLDGNTETVRTEKNDDEVEKNDTEETKDNEIKKLKRHVRRVKEDARQAKEDAAAARQAAEEAKRTAEYTVPAPYYGPYGYRRYPPYYRPYYRRHHFGFGIGW